MNRPLPAEWLRPRYLLPAMAILIVLVADRSPVDAGMMRLAGWSSRYRDTTDWTPVQMYSVANVALASPSVGQNANALLSGDMEKDARPVFHSFIPQESSLPTRAPQAPSRTSNAEDGPSSPFDLAPDRGNAPGDFTRQGWLAEAVQSAEQSAVDGDRTLFPDVSGTLDTDLFGRNDEAFGSASESPYNRRAGLFDDDNGDEDPFSTLRETRQRSGEARPDAGLFSFEGNVP